MPKPSYPLGIPPDYRDHAVTRFTAAPEAVRPHAAPLFVRPSAR